MLGLYGRKPASVVAAPVAKLLLRLGLSANAVTILGTLATIAVAVALIPTGHLVLSLIHI